ncbi:MAG: glycosyltransferase family 2 protein [Candidatus Kapabacteria bacterium]|nr:glycosyltransferase family 2 protein [Ignavibacteriota bacterium]MCW5884652.1 glycosyltransferase family 2 protein [Candidatus Kapabacteria bacterium]
MNNRVTIGLLMLTKNSRSTVQAALNSASPYMSQMVVVDTGSEDDTVQIAIRSGAEVYFFNWIDDFSAARNFALKHIHTDWVLMLDSDEVLSFFDIEIFYQLIDKINIGGINILIDNMLEREGNFTTSSHRYTRLFKRDDSFFFTGKIHEQIRNSIEAGGFEIIESDFKILHMGYQNFDKQKNERNTRLLQIDSSENPEDDWLKLHLAETHFTAGRIIEAEGLLNEILYSKMLSVKQKELAKLRLAQISLGNDNYQESINLTEFSSDDFQNEALRLYVRGTSFLFMKKYEESIHLLEKCLAVDSPSLVQSDVRRVLELAKKLFN